MKQKELTKTFMISNWNKPFGCHGLHQKYFSSIRVKHSDWLTAQKHTYEETYKYSPITAWTSSVNELIDSPYKVKVHVLRPIDHVISRPEKCFSHITTIPPPPLTTTGIQSVKTLDQLLSSPISQLCLFVNQIKLLCFLGHRCAHTG